MKILIAEDDGASRLILERCLKRLGADYLVARDGDEAWALYQENQVDVVISDWMMPGLDGLELCKRVREHQESGYTYFIMLTALSEKKDLITGMEAGADDYLTKPLDWDALRAGLIAAERVTTLHRRISEQSAELARLNQKLYDEGRTDALTRLRNRLCLNEDLIGLADSVVRYGHSYCIVLADIDYYKRYNDYYGHLEGDNVLVKVADAISRGLRAGDRAYRYGGEEFLVILPEQTIESGAIAVERIQNRIAELGIEHEKSPVQRISMSFGMSTMSPSRPRTFKEVLAEADAALYQSKEMGRNRLMAFSDSGIVAVPHVPVAAPAVDGGE